MIDFYRVQYMFVCLCTLESDRGIIFGIMTEIIVKIIEQLPWLSPVLSPRL